MAQHHVGIRDRRLLPSLPVRRGPGYGAGALRPHPEQTTRVDPRDAAASSTDRIDVQPRRTDRPAGALALVREPRLEVIDQRDLAARTAHVERDHAAALRG